LHIIAFTFSVSLPGLIAIGRTSEQRIARGNMSYRATVEHVQLFHFRFSFASRHVCVYARNRCVFGVDFSSKMNAIRFCCCAEVTLMFIASSVLLYTNATVGRAYLLAWSIVYNRLLTIIDYNVLL